MVPTLNYRKYIIKEEIINQDKCRMCQSKSETLHHILPGCTLHAPKEYQKRYDKMAKTLHQELYIHANIFTWHIYQTLSLIPIHIEYTGTEQCKQITGLGTTNLITQSK